MMFLLDVALQIGQQELVKAIAATGKPVVLVVITGQAIALDAEKESCAAILYAFLPSEAGGTAIINTLLGDAAPSGRLPITLYPRSILFERDPGDMNLRNGPGLTYLHYPTSKTVYPFGFGLSYSQFDFAWSDDFTADRGLALPGDFDKASLPRVRVTNTGAVRSAITIQGYILDIRLDLTDVPVAE